MEHFRLQEKAIATFALTRGYQGLHKLKYIYILRRNRSIRKNLKASKSMSHLLFHEGNISKSDQFLLKRFSSIKLQFIDISHVFKPSTNHRMDWLSAPGLGYRLMCRFHYQQVWDFLRDYEIAIRIDEDCFVSSLSNIIPKQIMSVGYISKETHENTKISLPKYLNKLNLKRFYDDKFPYTNLFVTKVDFWLATEVQQFLDEVGEHPEALLHRWGDLPVLGVALKAFGGWDYQEGLDASIAYTHMSHRARIRGGEYKEGSFDAITWVFELLGKLLFRSRSGLANFSNLRKKFRSQQR